MPDHIYTIGHSNHSIEKFIELLKKHEVTAVADVRSQPYSRFNPQFNRENLQADLKAEGLAYVFLGRELGARSEDPSCYIDGRVQYNRIAKSPLFKQGLERIVQGAQRYRIALMCAEKDPLMCHRSILVCRYLASRGIDAKHIKEDGEIEIHKDALDRLLTDLGLAGQLHQPRPEDLDDWLEDLGQANLLLPLEHDKRIRVAYGWRGEEIAYTKKQPLSAEQMGMVE